MSENIITDQEQTVSLLEPEILQAVTKPDQLEQSDDSYDIHRISLVT